MTLQKSLQTARLSTPEFELSKLPPILLAWYAKHARPLPWRKDCVAYHVWVSEIMLQQTRAEVVKDYYVHFIEKIPTVKALANIDEQKLLKLWEGLGYYSRARNLQKAARLITYEYNGQFPNTYEQLLTLPGVGPYTAGAIASICFDEPVPAVDGNVLRIVSRIAGISEYIDTPAMKKRITASLAKIYPKTQRGAFTQSLMELGATVCLPNGMPKCPICPAAHLCSAHARNSVLDFPVRKDKKSRRIQQITVLALYCQERVAIRLRKKSGLLAGLWELPNIPGQLDEQHALHLAEKWDAAPVSIAKVTRRTHVFTHIEWDMTCYYLTCTARPDRFVWADSASLDNIYALPTAFKKILLD